jgi:hypothetical protein
LALIAEVNKYKNDLAVDGTYVKNYLNTNNAFQGRMETLNKQAMKEKSETKDKTTSTVF